MIENLPSYIKSRRQNIGLTQKQLAELVGVTDVTISRWESGQREPIMSDFLKLCEVLGLNMDDFINRKIEGVQEIIVPKLKFDNVMSYDDFIGKGGK